MKTTKTTTEATPAVYVGTYSKYNSGSIAGKWLQLTDYNDKDEFYAACAELHDDEEDPEFMFQDWEFIPDGLIGESWLSDNIFDVLNKLAELSEHEKEAFNAYLKYKGNDLANEDINDIYSDFEDAYQGEFSNDEDFAYDMAEQLGLLEKNLSWPYTCIDWEYAARELMYDYFEEDGHYFRSM